MSEIRITLIDGQQGEIEDLQSGNLVEVYSKSLGHLLLCCITEIKDKCLHGPLIDMDACNFPKTKGSGEYFERLPLDEISSIKVHATAGQKLFQRLVEMVGRVQGRIHKARVDILAMTLGR